MGYIIIVCIVILVISGIAALKFESIANMKGHSGYFWWCFLLGAIGWAMVIALPDRKEEYVLGKSGKSIAPEMDDALPDL